MDLLCSDCKAAHPPLMEWFNGYASDDQPIDEYIDLYIHMFPLPYHHHAFIVSKAALLTYFVNGNG